MSKSRSHKALIGTLWFVSIYSIDGNVNWRCGEIGIRYALMGKTGSSCMQVQILLLPMERCRLGFVGVVKLGIHDRLKICCRKA